MYYKDTAHPQHKTQAELIPRDRAEAITIFMFKDIQQQEKYSGIFSGIKEILKVFDDKKDERKQQNKK